MTNNKPKFKVNAVVKIILNNDNNLLNLSTYDHCIKVNTQVIITEVIRYSDYNDCFNYRVKTLSTQIEQTVPEYCLDHLLVSKHNNKFD